MAPKARPIRDRFEAFVERVPFSECWYWTGVQSKYGYGRFSGPSGFSHAHRVSWELSVGPIPEGLVVCHRCNVKLCVNPSHLYLGTQKENVRDAIKDGLWPAVHGSTRHPESRCRGDAHWTRKHPERLRGVANNSAKLSDTAVIDILGRSQSAKEFAAKYGVALGTVYGLWGGKGWKHLRQASEGT